MCKNMKNSGFCEYQDLCSFAHTPDELKEKTDVPKNYKTKLCKRYHKDLFCPYGSRCQFLHGEETAQIKLKEGSDIGPQTKEKVRTQKQKKSKRISVDDELKPIMEELKKFNFSQNSRRL